MCLLRVEASPDWLRSLARRLAGGRLGDVSALDRGISGLGRAPTDWPARLGVDGSEVCLLWTDASSDVYTGLGWWSVGG